MLKQKVSKLYIITFFAFLIFFIAWGVYQKYFLESYTNYNLSEIKETMNDDLHDPYTIANLTNVYTDLQTTVFSNLNMDGEDAFAYENA